MPQIGTVGALCRYPVKSMLGEDRQAARVTLRGLEGDRDYALIDVQSGKVATAKLPHRWRAMLRLRSIRYDDGDASRVEIALPDGRIVDCEDPGAEAILSAELGRSVKLASARPEGLEMECADPDAVVAQGSASEVGFDVLPVGMGAPEGGFFDFAPIHFITSASLDRVGSATAARVAEPSRYRANLIIETPAGVPFQENDWIGARLDIGREVQLEVIVPTPRCAVPTLAHGAVAVDVKALQAIAVLNKAQVLDMGLLPCLGAYAKVLRPGSVRVGDPVELIRT